MDFKTVDQIFSDESALRVMNTFTRKFGGSFFIMAETWQFIYQPDDADYYYLPPDGYTKEKFVALLKQTENGNPVLKKWKRVKYIFHPDRIY